MEMAAIRHLALLGGVSSKAAGNFLRKERVMGQLPMVLPACLCRVGLASGNLYESYVVACHSMRATSAKQCQPEVRLQEALLFRSQAKLVLWERKRKIA